ncbi:hypothetical protein QE152_g35754 [Popillia japonica]|uniref:Uncharacterized protein n=1 Tax=Popillia japonica TaxID=7064 RepID=A0AAW1IF93_POPJA
MFKCVPHIVLNKFRYIFHKTQENEEVNEDDETREDNEEQDSDAEFRTQENEEVNEDDETREDNEEQDSDENCEQRLCDVNEKRKKRQIKTPGKFSDYELYCAYWNKDYVM